MCGGSNNDQTVTLEQEGRPGYVNSKGISEKTFETSYILLLGSRHLQWQLGSESLPLSNAVIKQDYIT